MNKQQRFEEEVTKELGYISSLFMSQECKGTEIVMPTEELKEAVDRISLYNLSSNNRVLQAYKEELGREVGKLKKEEYTEMAKGVMCAVKGAKGYNQALSDILSLITNPTKE